MKPALPPLTPALAPEVLERLPAVTADSRTVTPGGVFVALPGAHHNGSAFIPQALAAGARLVVADPASVEAFKATHPDAPLHSCPDPARWLALMAEELARRHQGPAPDCVVAVTGTNGKTSTADFLRQLWKREGLTAASIGTLGLVSDVALPAPPALTTPDAVSMASALHDLAQAGVNHVVVEASSHGLAQRRLDGVPLKGAGFTNLTRDHLDYHGTMADYGTAKMRLFDTLLPPGAVAAAVTALEGAWLERLRATAQSRGLHWRLVGERSKGGERPWLEVLEAMPEPGGQRVQLAWQGKALPPFLFPVPGRFQLDNALLALALCAPAGTGEGTVKRLVGHLEHLKGVPGRCECCAMLPQGAGASPAALYVDYAHTPDALEKVLDSLRPHVAPGGRLWVVLGAGGDRDRGKRPLMGAAAVRGADGVIITDDNPRHEDPAAIRQAVLEGALAERAAQHQSKLIHEVAGRAQALQQAVAGLGPGDVLLVAGKGHEKGQIIGDEVHPFDDRALTAALAHAQALQSNAPPANPTGEQP
ncbi:UDP-N-acetylmuramoyl-L-alanyl-D-glutamate--2,6-diaminopimelate ligase [Formicincola oecophyllae]|uniref:UDP-N-acetylmuramoyl-L-alanyl-D-glutamate--2,6-diaminopimelate ligase n=1 Tax=Formicincola oecophyllae TaxID=2558361 RepID=A0A4Y6UA23_9PROT|nr:UDP-N-acetylmuramoyl-L-alanyl-D-glutamate--2,6-diaminopimelate ligase [Formicincola oecophyllae]QDH13005.1 UDP-N-acetylmuramoyl-L-alanyl-D-glutamate--2,6-diaminopimelate ligase [Formicincola oecophyllae]